MPKSETYYWLKLMKDFFDNAEIDWLLEQNNGSKYCIFYLKLCIQSMNTEGILIREIGCMKLPYNIEKLAEVTKTPNETAIIAFEVLKGTGLIKILENGAIWLPQVPYMVGKETLSAVKKRNQREKQLNKRVKGDIVLQLSPQCPSKIHPDIEEEEELLLSVDNNNNSSSPKKCEMPVEVKAIIDEIFERSEHL